MQSRDFFTINMRTFKVTMIYLFYRIILDLIYLKWVNPIFDYSGFTLDINESKIFFSYIITFLLIIIVPKNEKKVSYMVLQLHLIIMIIPFLTLYSMANLSTNFLLMVCFCFLLQIIFLKMLPTINLKKIKNAKPLLICILVFLTFLTYAYLLKTQKLNLNAFDLANIYNIRSKQIISSTFVNYSITWQYRIINPTILVFSYYKKKSKLTCLAIVMQVILYLMYPHKEIFLSLGLIGFILFLDYFKYKFYSFFILFLLVTSITFAIVYDIVNILMPFGIIPVRLLYVPALIKFQHYDFFLNNQKLYYSEGMIGKILGLEYPYSMPSGYVVSGGVNNSNTGYLAYAFDNAGFIGMIFITLIFIFLMVLIDSIVKKENKKAIFALLVYPMIMLNDGDLLTLLLTGGLFLLIIILFVFGNLDIQDQSEKPREGSCG